MARFYGRVRGQSRNAATRLGGPISGLQTSCNGWDLGVDVSARAVSKDTDAFEIRLTTGSSKKGKEIFLGTVVLENNEPTLLITEKGKLYLR